MFRPASKAWIAKVIPFSANYSFTAVPTSFSVAALRCYSTPLPPPSPNPPIATPLKHHHRNHIASPKTIKPPRKASSEAKPIRSNRSPSLTRSNVRHTISFSTARAYNLSVIESLLPKEAKRIMTGESSSCIWVPLGAKSRAVSGLGPLDERTGLVDSEDLGSDENGEIWLLENGSFVSWGLDRAVAWQWWQNLVKPSGFEIGKYESVEDESLDFYVDPAEPTTRLMGDIIILSPTVAKLSPRPDDTDIVSSLLSRYTFSEALSRSSQLSILEAQLSELIDKVAFVPGYLAREGRGPYKRKEVVQRLGEFLSVRQAVNLQGVNDIPELYWDEPVLEKYFDGLMRALEVRQRVHILNEKITHAQEVHAILKDLLVEKSGHDMEIIIIALIAVEASLAIWSHWEGLMDALGFVSAVPVDHTIPPIASHRSY